jgi:hypothetical protein
VLSKIWYFIALERIVRWPLLRTEVNSSTDLFCLELLADSLYLSSFVWTPWVMPASTTIYVKRCSLACEYYRSLVVAFLLRERSLIDSDVVSSDSFPLARDPQYAIEAVPLIATTCEWTPWMTSAHDSVAAARLVAYLEDPRALRFGTPSIR